MLKTLNHLGNCLARLLGEPKRSINGISPTERAQARAYFDYDPLASLLPYEGYNEEHKVFINPGSLGFAIEAVPVVGGEEATQKEILSLFQETLQEGASMQCLLWADHRVAPFLRRWELARQNADPIYHSLASRRSDYLQSSPRLCTRIFRCILSYSIPRSGSVTPAQLKSLTEVRDKILSILNGLTFAFPWDANHFLSSVGGLINFSHDPDIHKRHWNPCDTLAAQLPTGGLLQVEKDHLAWDNNEHAAFRSYRVVGYPSSWSLNGMQQLIGDIMRDSFRIHTPFFLHYGVHCPKQTKAESNFKMRSQLIEHQGKSSMLRRLIPELDEELQECNAIRHALKEGARFVWTQFAAGIWAQPDHLAKEEQALKSLFRIHGFTVKENTCLHLPTFLSCLPMTWAKYAQDLKDLGTLKTTLTYECSNLVPIQGEWLGTPTPGTILVGRRGQLLNWNPFDNRGGNYNVVVAGRSGSGKSVFMQDLLVSGLGTGARVFVLEVGRSFEKMCSCLSGQQIAFGKGSPICLNPFTHILPSDQEEQLASFSMIKSVIACMASPNQGTNDYENALIEKAVLSAWDKKKNEATITDVAAWFQQHKDKQANILGVMLTPYCKGGVHARHFEGPNNIDFTSPMVLIELEELKEKKDLQSVVIQLFIMTITNQAFLGDRTTPFYICIDEAWDLLRGKQTGVFIETLARRLRKYKGSLVIGTQSVDDFFATPGALAAFENSDWMCLLAQKKSSIARLSESGRINLSDSMQYALESVSTRHGEYSEVMICDADGNYSIARLILDPFSELLYTTKAEEYAQIKELQQQGLSIVEAINQLLKEREEACR